MSDRKHKAAAYRRQAQLCLEVAEQMSLDDDRAKMKEMAKQWLELAEKMESASE